MVLLPVLQALKSFRLALVPLLVTLGLTACIKEPEPRLRVGTFPRPGFDPLFLARSLGCYDDDRLQLVEFPSASDMLIAYRNGALDAATVTTDDALRLAADGEQLRIVLVLDYSDGMDAVLAKPDVPNLESLKGHAVAVESNSLGAFVLARALDAAGVSLDEVKIISCRADRMERDLSMGNADAVVTCEPYRSRLIGRGLASLYDSRQMAAWEISGVLVVPKKLADKPPAALHELAIGWFQAVAYLADKPEDAARRMAGRAGFTPKHFTNTLQLLKYTGRKENAYQLSAPHAAFSERLRETAAFMWKTGMLKSELNPSPLRSDVLLRGEP